jgi:hypothetical protein
MINRAVPGLKTGTFMVVARGRGGQLHALWNVKDLAEKLYAQRDEIGRWMHLSSSELTTLGR